MRFPATNARAIEVDRCSIANDGVVNHAGPSGQQRESQREQHHCNEGVLLPREEPGELESSISLIV
jgi:hypothetical protein